MASTHRFTAILSKEEDQYVALCPELDVASQGKSVEEARANLVEALETLFETAPPDEMRTRVRGPVWITSVEIEVA